MGVVCSGNSTSLYMENKQINGLFNFSENNQFYERSLAENIEGITDINIARAAKELWKMCRPRTAATESDEPMRIAYHRFLDIEKSINKMNEYFWLVKGFVQVVQGIFWRCFETTFTTR